MPMMKHCIWQELVRQIVVQEVGMFQSEYRVQLGFQSAPALTSWVPVYYPQCIRFRRVAHYVKVVATQEATGCNLDSPIVLRTAELVCFFFWTLCWRLSLRPPCSKAATKIVKVNSYAVGRREKSALGMTFDNLCSHVAREVATVQLGQVDPLNKADMLFCPIRLMSAPREETTVLRRHITPSPPSSLDLWRGMPSEPGLR